MQRLCTFFNFPRGWRAENKGHETDRKSPPQHPASSIRSPPTAQRTNEPASARASHSAARLERTPGRGSLYHSPAPARW
ncbi:hypothetical protein BT67DRAFT_11959 [Trichocladium antarcticum]|uniref:Uncharacterized protein n=1 Tax=Trichocladium antarcticum TaxID=1450529 RepID=A0AAN6UT61_9PEZI|nr:hypothetical protein BT67DRAFT_11959 [Trichocladium antarcticum]